MKITGLAAGCVGGPTLAMIAAKCPDIEVTVVDPNADRTAARNSERLHVYEPGLDDVLKSARGRNLHFRTDVEKPLCLASRAWRRQRCCAATPVRSGPSASCGWR